MKKIVLDILTSLKNKLNNKGSTTILILIILSTIISITIMLVNTSENKAKSGMQRSMLTLSSRSVLSEYSKTLKDEYGIFAFDLTTKEISDKIKFYIKSNTKINPKINRLTIDRYMLTNTQNFENQIVEYSKFAFVDHIINKDKKPTNDRKGDRVLKNQRVISILPSKNIKGNSLNISDIAEAMKDIDGLFDKGKKTVLGNMYILNMFNNRAEDNGDTFFKHEVEYIISGKLDDQKNYKSVRRKIVLVRNMINLAVIYNTPELKGEVLTMAALAGVGVEIAIPIIAEAWALIEAENDMKILENGGKVPILKNKDTWATDIKSIIENEEDKYIDNNSQTGMDYRDYLHVLLYFTDKELRYLRTMDLMQINIQGKYDETFNINLAATGFSYDINIDKNRYKYDEKY